MMILGNIITPINLFAIKIVLPYHSKESNLLLGSIKIDHQQSCSVVWSRSLW